MRDRRERERAEKPRLKVLEQLVSLRLQNEVAFPQLKMEAKKLVAKPKVVKTKDVTVTVYPSKAAPKRFVENLVLKYGHLYSKEQIEKVVRTFMSFNVEMLKKLLKDEVETADGIEFIKFIKERRNAERSLHEAGLGHIDPHMNYKNLESRLQSVPLREELWREAMDTLRAEGYHYFVAKKAADDMAFPEGILNYADPYWYRDEKNPTRKRHLDHMASLSEKRFIDWSKEPGERKLTKRQLTLLLEDQEVEEAKQRKINGHLRLVRPVLIHRIEAGYSDKHILRECEKKHWSVEMREIFADELKRLRKQYKPKKIMVELEEE